MTSLPYLLHPATSGLSAERLGETGGTLATELDLAPEKLSGLLRAAGPLCAWLGRRRRAAKRPLVVGLSGAQGSGKSTLCRVLQAVLKQRHGTRTCGFSLDDLYLTRARRRRLAETVHPLLATRGAPGTHDIALGIALLDHLLHADETSSIQVPVFAKAIDDRLPTEGWPVFVGKPDLILLEGWCVGIGPQTEAELDQPINPLEATEDPTGLWRRYVNNALDTSYRKLFSRLDVLIFLQVPGFDSVRTWRRLQEEKLARQNPTAPGLMDIPTLDRFLQHYERLTHHALATLPTRADAVCLLDSEHEIAEIHSRERLPETR